MSGDTRMRKAADAAKPCAATIKANSKTRTRKGASPVLPDGREPGAIQANPFMGR
jgi:hypothetical protein